MTSVDIETDSKFIIIIHGGGPEIKGQSLLTILSGRETVVTVYTHVVNTQVDIGFSVSERFKSLCHVTWP